MPYVNCGLDLVCIGVCHSSVFGPSCPIHYPHGHHLKKRPSSFVIFYPKIGTQRLTRPICLPTMDLALHPGPPRLPVARATRSNGCWTCRLRRKKCDEKRPVCDVCTALSITCHFDQARPDWMDGGARQEEMAVRLKQEVKEKAAQRRATHSSGDSVSPVITVGQESATGNSKDLLISAHDAEVTDDATIIIPETHSNGEAIGPDFSQPEVSTVQQQRGKDCSRSGRYDRESAAFGRSDTVLLTFYLEQLFPFLFPFYRPSLLEGGRAWVLEMMISSPVVRQAALCQSSYFFSLARERGEGGLVWEAMLQQTGDVFEVVRESLQVIQSSGVTEHVHGAVRIMSSILQVQRFEAAVLSFRNCWVHLNAARSLFKQLLDGSSAAQPAEPSARFKAVMDSLGPPSWIQPVQLPIPSAEQAAFRFSSALLILDDIIASTVLQEEPTLYEYHHSLLCGNYVLETPVDLEAIVGCQNWALLQIGQIAALDAWKQRCKTAGNLNVMDLVSRATTIKDSLETHLEILGTDPVPDPAAGATSLLDIFAADHGNRHADTNANSPASQTRLVTRVWAHTALAYLSVVVSGWQPASVDVRHNVGRVVELLTCEMSPPALLSTMVWPFCVAGCLAEPAQDEHLRGMVEALQPPSVFGTLRKALEIMEGVWRRRDAGDNANRDLAMCFRSQGGLVLLV